MVKISLAKQLMKDLLKEDLRNAGADTGAILGKDIDEIEWSQRATNCFRRAGIRTLKDLTGKTEGELMRLRGFGKLCLKEINEKLGAVGLALKKE